MFAGIISIMFFSCKESPTDIGIGLLKNNIVNLKTLDSSADSLKQTSSYFHKTIPLGVGSKLMLGNYKNVSGSVLLKFLFVTLPDSIATDVLSNVATIKSSVVYMFPYVTYGDSTTNLDFTVHKVNSYWGTATFDADSLPALSYDANDISSNKNIVDTSTSFSIDNSLVKQWIALSVDSNYSSINGIYIKPTPDTKKLVEFQAFTSLTGNYSQLSVVFEKAGVYSDTISFYPIGDISVIQSTQPQVNKDEMVVQGGSTYNSKLWFDVSKIPANSTINQATLTLTMDSARSDYVTSIYNGLFIWNLSDSSAVTIDSSNSVVIGLSGNIFQGDITKLVQSWVDKHKNQGMLLEDYNMFEGVDLYAIKNGKSSDYSLRPKLRISYTTRN